MLSPSFESERLAEQKRLDAQKSQRERNVLGQFATPTDLAAAIMKRVADLWPNGKAITFLEPAVGTGSFLSALVSRFPPNQIDAMTGVEIDEGFADAARLLWSGAGVEVRTANFAALTPERHYNLIVTNPPYVRHHHLSAGDKELLRKASIRATGLALSGLAGLYTYFLLIAHDWLEEDGIGVWLIPSEFMDVNYGETVKRYLAEQVTLIQIHRFCPSDVQFDDALVSSAVVIFRKGQPSQDHKPVFSFGGEIGKPDIQECVPLPELRGKLKWSNYAHPRLQNGSAVHTLSLADCFTIKRGLATGSNNFFILPRERAEELGIPDECVRPILPSPRHLPLTVVDADALGYPDIDCKLLLIDCSYPEEVIEERWPRFFEYLQSGKTSGTDLTYLCSKRSPWYSQEKREPARFLCTYMGRSRETKSLFRFIHNRSRAVATNVWLMLYPKPALLRALESEPALWDAVHSELNSITSESFLAEGRVYGGGLQKMEPSELGRLPLSKRFETWLDQTKLDL